MELISHQPVAGGAAHLFIYRFSGGGAEIVTSVTIDVDDPKSARRYAANLLAEMAKEMAAGIVNEAG